LAAIRLFRLIILFYVNFYSSCYLVLCSVLIYLTLL